MTPAHKESITNTIAGLADSRSETHGMDLPPSWTHADRAYAEKVARDFGLECVYSKDQSEDMTLVVLRRPKGYAPPVDKKPKDGEESSSSMKLKSVSEPRG